ncbi:MAG: aminotransferase class III-fold pyridoxal phosphate-dependent enzyme, partial [Planctomycetes bacterium]|nr:aminotransferase class III-fold pyridoxal phosphate-dependent enzyme [Planctomycetota bacterium]
DHVLFAGTTHEPAVQLAERLVEISPEGLERVFFSDNGSTAVEVALKMVVQAWQQRGERSRETFVALAGGYHGDTCGAMSVGDPDPFFAPYRSMLFDVRRTAPDVDALAAILDELGRRAAGVIVEPLVQGAGGMRMHDDATLRALARACEARGVPWIADEVMTGFGRTGALFACRRAGVEPDVMCLSKGITGGILPLAVTLATDELFEAFVSDDRGRMLFHGHSFTANPITCAVALASLDLVEERDVPTRLDAIGATIEARLAGSVPATECNLRRTGGIVALDLPGESGYLAGIATRIRRESIERGVLLRPLGEVLYALPPASTTDDEALEIADAMADAYRSSLG